MLKFLSSGMSRRIGTPTHAGLNHPPVGRPGAEPPVTTMRRSDSHAAWWATRRLSIRCKPVRGGRAACRIDAIPCHDVSGDSGWDLRQVARHHPPRGRGRDRNLLMFKSPTCRRCSGRRQFLSTNDRTPR